MRSVIGMTVALVTIFADTQIANAAATCYRKVGSACTAGGKSGWDSTCRFKCAVTHTIDGSEIVKLYINGHWQIQAKPPKLASPRHA